MGGRAGASRPLIVNGWTRFAHPIFLDRIDALIAPLDALDRKDPAGYTKKDPPSNRRPSPGWRSR